MQFLFFTRLFLYILAFSLPAVHPSIVVPYDRIGWWMWFFLVPGEMFIGFYLAPPRMRVFPWLLTAAGFLFLTAFVISGISSYTFYTIIAGSAVFLLTVFIFKGGTRGHIIAVVEQFFLGFLYYKLLTFSRASESVAEASAGLNRVIMALIIIAFLLHGVILYKAAFHGGKRKRKLTEILLFFMISVPAVLIIVLILPENFVSHSSVLNLFKPEPKPKPIPLEDEGGGITGGNLQSRNLMDGPWMRDSGSGSRRRGDYWGEDGEMGSQRDSEGYPGQGQGRLEGIPSEDWNNQRTGTGSSNKQYAVMVVASNLDRVYAANAYYGRFDKELGFVLSRESFPEYELNELPYIRLLDTWKNKESIRDLKRFPSEVFYLSTIPERVLAYKPFTIEPTVLNRKYHPFDFSYRSVSLISGSGPQEWAAIRGLDYEEKNSLRNYLEVPLTGETREVFESYLERNVGEHDAYYEKIIAIFMSFSSFQYELGFDDDVSIGKMEMFLSETRQGDCTEFSNSTAILARMSGVPSRVVTGYLAARELQAFAHLRAIRMLREVVEPLKLFPPRDLLLVTTAHRHSWVQLYMPGYGWVDFDPTSYAIPPVGFGDPNSMDVVIPLIRIEEEKPAFEFPWLLVLQGLAVVLLGSIVALYMFRFGKQLYLKHLSGGRSLKALKALYNLQLLKLSSNGYALKAPSRTPIEYAEKYPELSRFASLYTVLRYRESFKPGEKNLLWDELLKSYKEVITNCKKTGIFYAFRRFFNLRGLYYLW
jgi:transglutaminase-like putative cysteine protease